MVNWPFKLEKISTKLGVNFYGRAEIQILTTDWSTSRKDLDFSTVV